MKRHNSSLCTKQSHAINNLQHHASFSAPAARVGALLRKVIKQSPIEDLCCWNEVSAMPHTYLRKAFSARLKLKSLICV